MAGRAVFTGKCHVVGGSHWAMQSSDRTVDIKPSRPHPTAEQLFGSAWSACFIASIQAVAAQMQISVPNDIEIEAQVDLMANNGAFHLEAELLVGMPGLDRKTAEKLVSAAHDVCPYSKVIRGNVDVTLRVVEFQTAQSA